MLKYTFYGFKKKGGAASGNVKHCHAIPSHSSYVLLKAAEFAFKDTETNDESAVISPGKEQSPAETSSGQSTNSAAGGLLASCNQT